MSEQCTIRCEHVYVRLRTLSRLYCWPIRSSLVMFAGKTHSTSHACTAVGHGHSKVQVGYSFGKRENGPKVRSHRSRHARHGRRRVLVELFDF